MDPVEISNALGLTPQRTTRAGASRTSPKGEALAGAYEFSYWTHQFDTEGASELGLVLEGLVERLKRNQQFLHQIVKDGGSVQLFCGVFAAGNWDEILSHTLMGRLAELRVDLRLDVYPKEKHTAT
jgi:hypothetical protein